MNNRLSQNEPLLSKRAYDGLRKIWIAYVLCQCCKGKVIKHECDNLFEALDESRLLDAWPICFDCAQEISP